MDFDGEVGNPHFSVLYGELIVRPIKRRRRHER